MKIDKWIVKDHIHGIPDVNKIYEKVTVDVDVVLKEDEMLLKTLLLKHQ